MTDEQIINKIKDLGDKVFLNPTGPLFKIEKNKSTNFYKLKKNDSMELCEKSEVFELSLSGNTFRGFHREEKNKSGPKKLFREILNDKYIGDIIEKLKIIENEDNLITIKDEIIEKLKENLKENIKNDLDSYNKIGKPVDLFLEHLVSLCKEFSEDERKKIIPLLFLPLDSQIFQSNLIFNDDDKENSDLKKLKIDRGFTFSDIKDKDHYLKIQNFIKDKANNLGINRIYFDLIWGERYLYEGNNFDELTQKVICNKKNMDEKRKANSQIVTKILKATN